MFYVYLLKSLKNGDIYVGFSADLKQRYRTHNEGRVKATKAYLPWKLIYYEAYLSEKDARKREINLKNHKPKNDLIKQIKESIEEE